LDHIGLGLWGVVKDATGAALMMPEAAIESMKPPAAAAIKVSLSFMGMI